MSDNIENNTSTTDQTDQGHAKATLFVRGLPFSATSKDLEDFFTDIGPIRKCFVIANQQEEGSPGFKNKGFGYVHFALADDAQQAIDKLSSVKFKGGRKLKMELARRRKETTTEHASKQQEKKKPFIKPAKTTTTTHHSQSSNNGNKAARLIVRNLPWKYREQDLERVFGKHGKVTNVQLPRKYEGGPLRGFAFIQMETVEEAEKALESLNATEHVGRVIAVDWALSKDRYKQVEEENIDEEGDTTMEDTNNVKSTVEDNINNNEKVKEEDSDNDSSSDSDDSEEDSSDSENEDSDDDESDDEESDDNDEDSDNEESEDDDDDEKEDADENKKDDEKPKKRLPDADAGTTLFVRNLLFETNENDLKQLFAKWGPVLYARITRDRETGLSKGTGFVCMKKKEDADECIQNAEALRKMSSKDTTGDDEALQSLMSKREKKKNKLAYTSLLTPEASNELGNKFTLHGRVLDVTLAVDRQSANKLKDEKLNLKRKDDVRNLYLMREGVIFPNTAAAETISAIELQKRQMSFSQRKKFVSADPSLFISKTRLSIRNLPIKVDEKELRQLGIQSIQKFKEQVKRGIRTDLSKEEKEEGWQYLPKVKQAKIVRSKDRIDAATQLPRSKGYGFLEFHTHSHALASLRYLNNNPDLFDGKRLIVEFSLENSKVIERRNQRPSLSSNDNSNNKDRKRSRDSNNDDKKPFRKGSRDNNDKKPFRKGSRDNNTDKKPFKKGNFGKKNESNDNRSLKRRFEGKSNRKPTKKARN
ncbi:unnamed protein product [Cunninghamella echinulata]